MNHDPITLTIRAVVLPVHDEQSGQEPSRVSMAQALRAIIDEAIMNARDQGLPWTEYLNVGDAHLDSFTVNETQPEGVFLESQLPQVD